MLDIKEIFADNLRKKRRKRRLTQEKLAEKAEMSLQYLALLEMGRKFPSGEMLEKLAIALDIETYELLAVAPSATNELERLHQTIITDMKQIVKEVIKETINEECRNKQ
jgi:transcriptional regulator with XRE-family HTH domain